MNRHKIAAGLMLAAGMACGNAAAAKDAMDAKETVVSIGTGGVTGVYYPSGGAICRQVNRLSSKTSVACAVESTGGSIYNIENLRTGELQFGVVQSDWQYHAYGGTSIFQEEGPFKKLRAVFSIHSEPVTIIARDSSRIKHIKDIKGKRFNIGNPTSGARKTWEVIEAALGWKRSDLKLAAELETDAMGRALCDNKIDAFFWLVGHPSGAIRQILSTCKSHIVDATGPAVDKLLKEKPYYRKVTIPAGMYDDNKEINTFGVGATFVTTTDVPDEVVHTVVKAVFDELEAFKKLHKAFSGLKEAEMIKDALSAPLHPGAIRYYRERGWMK